MSPEMSPEEEIRLLKEALRLIDHPYNIKFYANSPSNYDGMIKLLNGEPSEYFDLQGLVRSLRIGTDEPLVTRRIIFSTGARGTPHEMLEWMISYRKGKVIP